MMSKTLSEVWEHVHAMWWMERATMVSHYQHTSKEAWSTHVYHCYRHAATARLSQATLSQYAACLPTLQANAMWMRHMAASPNYEELPDGSWVYIAQVSRNAEYCLPSTAQRTA